MSNKKPPPTRNTESSVATFFMTLLHAATTVHILHLQTSSFAKHIALDELYKALPDLTDSVIEAYQGRYGIISEYPIGYTPNVEDPVNFVETLRSFIDSNRASLGENTELQNLVDEIVSQLDVTLYKLRFLA